MEANAGALRKALGKDAVCERHDVAGGPCAYCLVDQNARLVQACNNRDAYIRRLEIELKEADRRVTDGPLVQAIRAAGNKVGAA